MICGDLGPVEKCCHCIQACARENEAFDDNIVLAYQALQVMKKNEPVVDVNMFTSVLQALCHDIPARDARKLVVHCTANIETSVVFPKFKHSVEMCLLYQGTCMPL